ncbi:MAG: hypothetical protein ACTHMS_03540 [Jatrophihabitans sp.]|uniref:hypothetical protein n=1 Tax=Jatrophihabitans sp. TaxID=1932789 RepID=UPI003F80421B
MSALTSQTTYAVGDQPVLGLQATNTASTPCLITLSDATVQLQVYNFETRVWGSDDCPNGGDRPVEQVLAPRVPVTVHVPWAGTTSSPGCKTVRQPVGAGSYTLYATLSGEHGAATSFAFH